MIQVNSLLTKFKRNDTMTMIVITLSSTPPMGLFRATTNKLNIVNTQRVLKFQLVGSKPGGCAQGAVTEVKELNSGQPRTNPVRGRVKGLNPGPPDYQYSVLTTRPLCLYPT